MAAPAAGSGKGKRKRPLSEDDVYLLLHRYAPGTILTALQEVAQHAEGRRIDWRAMVRKSATGISSAREYQMLWRHFAYHHDLDESVDAGDQPLGDDSDLECELEPVPNPSKEALSEASALAKALISGSSREQVSGHRVSLDASVLNSPNEKIVRVPSDKQLAQSHRSTNVTGSVSNSKQPSHLGPSPDPLDANGLSKKKKKPKTWSKEEDADLVAGVHLCGEGKWSDILHKYNFDNTRTSLQLSQRWALISKRPGASMKPSSVKHFTVASSEERKAALKAFSMAVGPMRGSSTLRSGSQQQSIHQSSTVLSPTIPEVKSTAAPSPAPAPAPVPVPVPVKVQVPSPLPQGQQSSSQAPPPKVSNALTKTRKKPAAQPNATIACSSIQAAAIAAGGRIATPSTAANFFKAAQSKNAVHIRSRVTGSSKSKASIVVVDPGTQPGGSQHLEPQNTSVPKSGPSVLTMHSTEHARGVSEVAAVNPPGPSTGAHLLESKKASSTTPAPASCDSEEKDDDSKYCVITLDVLFPEDAMEPEAVDLKAKQPEFVDAKTKQPDTVDAKAKQPETVDAKAKQPEIVDSKAKQQEIVDSKAKQPEIVDPKGKQSDTSDTKVREMVDSKDKDMLEFDQFVAAQVGSVNTDFPDKSKDVKSAPGGQGTVGCQKKQLKPLAATGKSIPVLVGAPVAGKNTKSPVAHGAAPTPTGILRGIVGTGNAIAPNKTVVRKVAAPTTTGGQTPLTKKQPVNVKGNQTPSTSVVGSGLPATSQASVAVNGARIANPPSISQANTAVNGVRNVNPPSSNQASLVVNSARIANPASSSQVSPGVNGANKANAAASSQASTVVNGGAKKANPPAGQ